MLPESEVAPERRWYIRDLHESDVQRVMALYDATRNLADTAPLSVFDLMSALRNPHPAVIALIGDDVVGFAVSEVVEDCARLVGLRLDPTVRGRGLGSGLIRSMEDHFLHLGVRRIEALLGSGQVGEEALFNRGFSASNGLTLFTKEVPLTPTEVTVLDEWGGELIDESHWEAIAGMAELKAVINERFLGPLLEPELSRQFGLAVPSAMVLFGPPGTGKTTFARAVAGRLGWPFVELLPSKLAAGDAGLAGELRRALRVLSQLDHVVAFIDEFDEIATCRTAEPDGRPVVNELLKAIPQFRSQPGRVLICATNFIERLDPAVIRPGRFDLVVPVGPPDHVARTAMWALAAARANAVGVDNEYLSSLSDGYSPADVGLAQQRAAFAGFQRARSGGAAPLTTQDFVDAISTTPASIGPAIAAAFAEERKLFERV
jgi:transitional endoplasmic reticulum ATPase